MCISGAPADGTNFHVSFYPGPPADGTILHVVFYPDPWLMAHSYKKFIAGSPADGSQRVKYSMEGRSLIVVHEEHDLGIITKDLRCGKQYVNAVKAANKILGMTKRIFTYKSEEIIHIMQLYKSLVTW